VFRVTTEDIRVEQTYWSREVAAILQIGDSTLRKWCGVLEVHGYRFIRDEHSRRAFTEHDALALRFFKELTQDKGVALESAAKEAVARFNRDVGQHIATSDTIVPDRSESATAVVLQQLLEHANRQEEFNKGLLQELADQRRYIEDSLTRRDALLMQHLRESLDAQKALAAAAAEQAAAAEARKWWKKEFWTKQKNQPR
jgi:hypothetical protein